MQLLPGQRVRRKKQTKLELQDQHKLQLMPDQPMLRMLSMTLELLTMRKKQPHLSSHTKL
jgi:hypothetical protein